MSRLSKGAVNRAEKAVQADARGQTMRAWHYLGRWKAPGMLGHAFTACPVIFQEWAGRDYRWVHDDRSAGMCPVCEQAANRIYYGQIGYARRVVGEYRLRQQMQQQAEVDAALEDMGLGRSGHDRAGVRRP